MSSGSIQGIATQVHTLITWVWSTAYFLPNLFFLFVMEQVMLALVSEKSKSSFMDGQNYVT